MRRISGRPALPAATVKRLATETAAIVSDVDSFESAKTRYGAARKSKWFEPVIDALGSIAGPGQRCMCCSGSEAAQVEHYRPKAIYPNLALTWKNFLWICGICNQAKGDRFEEGNPPLNPIDDDIWAHFFIDQYGNLTPIWDEASNDFDARAVRTIELYNLDRQALQESRQERLVDLREKVEDALALYRGGTLSLEEMEIRVLGWFQQPFQPDVASFFLEGPGSLDSNEPFRDFLVELA